MELKYKLATNLQCLTTSASVFFPHFECLFFITICKIFHSVAFIVTYAMYIQKQKFNIKLINAVKITN